MVLFRVGLYGNWTAEAKCRDFKNPSIMFAHYTLQKQVAQLCVGCPVIRNCLAEALDGRINYGVWGGMTETQRRKLIKANPDVTSWRQMIQDMGISHFLDHHQRRR